MLILFKGDGSTSHATTSRASTSHGSLTNLAGSIQLGKILLSLNFFMKFYLYIFIYR